MILQCEEPVTGRLTGQLILDYLTDTVISHKPSLTGAPLITPDSRTLVTVSETDGGYTITVQRITGN